MSRCEDSGAKAILSKASGSTAKDLETVPVVLGRVTEDLGGINESLRIINESLVGTLRDLRLINEAIGIIPEDLSAGIVRATLGVGQ